MQINFTIEPDQLVRSYVVYTLKDAAGTVQFVGHCRLSQLAALPDARANPLFRAVFPPGRPITIEAVEIAPNRHGAQNALWKYLQQYGRPFMIAHGIRAGMKGVPVICNETGEKFGTLKECCEAHGISGSALSNHLAQKPGYPTVRGKTYTRGHSAVLLHAQPQPPAPAVPLHAHPAARPNEFADTRAAVFESGIKK